MRWAQVALKTSDIARLLEAHGLDAQGPPVSNRRRRRRKGNCNCRLGGEEGLARVSLGQGFLSTEKFVRLASKIGGPRSPQPPFGGQTSETACSRRMFGAGIWVDGEANLRFECPRHPGWVVHERTIQGLGEQRRRQSLGVRLEKGFRHANNHCKRYGLPVDCRLWRGWCDSSHRFGGKCGRTRWLNQVRIRSWTRFVDSTADSGVETTVDSVADSGADAIVESGADSVADSVAEVDAGAATETSSEPATEAAIEAAIDSASPSDTDSLADSTNASDGETALDAADVMWLLAKRSPIPRSMHKKLTAKQVCPTAPGTRGLGRFDRRNPGRRGCCGDCGGP